MNAQQLQNTIVAWSDKTFGSSILDRHGRQMPIDRREGMLNHMLKEIEELRETPNSPMEMADIFMLLLDYAGHSGVTVDLLFDATLRKLQINMKRKWGPVLPDGSIEHVREDAHKPNI